ncbi:MotA/TolQ/ExbB proton channel family protein [Mangrovibacterium diazotrophicum]|uniref:MotA/TolQ/ExbB proton channel family protein n=1 Tax=Mangrovibacterium diazotrophicum TaxID=1261403 RepID=A0A419W7U6_9BACT|nr:MotA/TolQ/ExbB proton channel family protein [Mangrovibacterium diazotrophicum]RKD91528.1 MotA/TolQ/ExbB proton channel family protein [Mangrovibacterium diazotrophicum]
MKFTDLFFMGGPLFMGIVTIWTIAMLVFIVLKIIQIFVQQSYTKAGLDLILLFGSLAFVTGILGQAIGLFMAFDAIQAAGDISPALIAGGFKVSMIAPLYGCFAFVIGLLLWGILREIVIRKGLEN